MPTAVAELLVQGGPKSEATNSCPYCQVITGFQFFSLVDSLVILQ